jgi:hypothetical protein
LLDLLDEADCLVLKLVEPEGLAILFAQIIHECLTRSAALAGLSTCDHAPKA